MQLYSLPSSRYSPYALMNCELQGANKQNESIGEAVRKAENLGYSIFKSATAIKKKTTTKLSLDASRACESEICNF